MALLKEIGSNLYQRRIELSLPIEEVAAKTYIRLALLKALELGQSDQLPEPVFIQGLIRRYGDVLGLDGATLAKTFPIEIHGVLPSFLKNSNTSSQKLLGVLDRVMYFYVIYVLLVVSAAGGLFYLLRRPQTVGSTFLQKSNSLLVQQEKTVALPPLRTALSTTQEHSLPLILPH